MASIAVLLLLLSIQQISIAVDTITTTQYIKDGETIVSSGESFEMGFFSPSESKNRYVGIWYKKVSIRTVVWVANRETPITNTSGVLKVINPGIIALVLDGTNTIIWSSNTSSSTQNPVAQLLDSGNLVVKDANDDNPENFYWQSFDYPCDTHLPGMKLGKNFVTGLERYLSSWKSDDDPAPGDFTYQCDPSGYPQNILKKGSVEQYRSGPWIGQRFSGRPSIAPNTIYTNKLVFNREEVYYSYELRNNSVVSRFVLNQYGTAQRWIWVDPTQGWVLYLTAPTDNCDTYLLCGPYGGCNIGRSPVCGCLNKFVPKYPENWARTDWSHGCVRKTPLNCRNGDGFLKYSHVKLPDTRFSLFNESMTLKECELVCLKNCSCMAYANLDLRNGGSGCLLWFGDLLDIREFSEAGQDIYVRMASSELDFTVPHFGSNTKKGKIIKVSLPLIAGVVLLSLILAWYARKKKNLHLKRKGRLGYDFEQDYTSESHNEELELPLFGLSTVANATNNFSIDNKLGEGGFGPVYQGVMEEGRKIAVKRLSKTSRQGLDEFKNEVLSIARLQHRNLVKLQGCCIQGDEKMLIYEYMPNKSLDSFIFDEAQSTLLDWPKRFHIINGIARGLLYLHQDSRLRVIHRDLKASNILLDSDMNPKISDFGLARIFGGDETGRLKTKRVVGTYGYMSPEYAIDGIFSVKSDVFSFGALVLEIVSGKRNRGFIHPDHSHNLLGHAWILHTEGRSMELIDDNAALGESCCPYEVVRSIEVGLLCVQQCPDDRPNMSSVVLMLGSKGSLPQPKEPGFFAERTILEPQCSIHEISNTLLDGR